MKVTFGYQYFDADPDEIRKEEGNIDLQKAIDLFDTFPWEKQFGEISKRKESNISSTIPAVFFYENDKKFLSISASDDKGFFINYRDEGNLGELYVSNNILEKPQGISVEQLIEDFFKGEVEKTLKLSEFEFQTPQEIRLELELKKSKLLRPLLYPLLPFIYLFFDKYDPTQILPIILLMSGVVFVLTIPSLLLNLRYWRNDQNQSTTYEPSQKVLTIVREESTHKVKKSAISSIELVRPRTSQRAFQGYSYLRFRIGADTFIITHLTVDPQILLSILNVNFKDLEVFYPALERNVETEKQRDKRKAFYQQKRTEFLQTYALWETEKLKEVIAETDHYADYARSAAEEILSKRTATNSR